VHMASAAAIVLTFSSNPASHFWLRMALAHVL
jgi:hypothetical protein